MPTEARDLVIDEAVRGIDVWMVTEDGGQAPHRFATPYKAANFEEAHHMALTWRAVTRGRPVVAPAASS